jgi:multidrug transporter EmrE-like cation transporter
MPWLPRLLPLWVWLLLLLVVLELLADICAKQFGLSGRVLFGVLSILGYILANIAWLFSLRTGAQLSRGSIIFATLSGVGALLIGLLVYHERVSTLQVIGMLLGIGAIALLSLA